MIGYEKYNKALKAENALFQAPIEGWLAYADARTATAHAYSEEKIQAVLALMPAFFEDAIDLDKRMTGSTRD